MFSSRISRGYKTGLSILLGLFMISRAAAEPIIIDQVRFNLPIGEEISEGFLRSQINSESGMEFSADLLAADIRRLYETGLVYDVESKVEAAEAANRVNLIFHVTPSPVISSISITGNQAFSDSRISSEFPLSPGERLNTNQLLEGRRRIRELYERRGYHMATVSVEDVQSGYRQVSLEIRINEDNRHKVGSVSFTGNQHFSDRQLRRQLETGRNIWSYLFSTGFLDPAELEEDKQRLREFYRDRGYLEFEIVEIEKDYKRRDKWVSLTFHVDEGRQYTVNSVRITGNQEFSDRELLEGLDLRENMEYSLGTQRRDLAWLRGRYHARGFLDFNVRPALDTDSYQMKVDINYVINEGKPARIRDILVVGNSITQDRVIRREVAVQPGDLADSRKLEQTRARLRNLQYFQRVQVTPLPTEQEDQKDLEIAVEEQMTGRWGIGGGVSSDTGLFGFFEMQETNFDLGKFLRFRDWPPKGAGQRISFRANVGTDINEFVFSLVEPWLLGYRLRMQTDLHVRSFRHSEYTEERAGGAVTLTRMVSLGPDRAGRQPWWRGDWRQSVGYRLDQIRLTSFSPALSPELRAEEGNYIASAINFGFSRDTRDSFVMPTRGATLGLSTELQSEAIGAYSNIYKLNLYGSRYISLGGYRLLTDLPVIGSSILKLSGDLATVDSLSGSRPAIFDRYFAGGQYSFRGFDYRQISPVDSNQDPVGGGSRLLGTGELMYPLHETVWLSLFCDFGNVWRGAWDWSPGDLNASAGLGLQLNLQAIPLRIDYGLPVSTSQKHLEDAGGTLHFSLGRSF